ncbi:MAG: YdeI/OmpD-associated family protein [Chloroflexota bacterium]
MVKLVPHDIRFFETPAQLRDWFDANHTTAEELWLGIHRKLSGRPTVDWSHAVDEALCVGWIDGIAKGIDEVSRAQRFTPRRKGSNWSAINVAKVAELTAQGRMRPAGIAAFEARTEAKTAVYSYEREATAFSDEETARFRADASAWTDWERRPPWYRKTVTHWVTGAKKTETRERRLAQLMEDSRAGRAMRRMSWPRKLE